MILSGKEIEKHIGKEIVIEPYDPKRLNPNSYNLSLHHELLVYENRQLDMKMPNPVKKLTKKFVCPPEMTGNDPVTEVF